MRKKCILLCSVLLVCLSCIGQQTFNIKDYGAKGDGVFNNTKAFQKAIDNAAISGGIVIVPKGRFMTGPIVLKTGVELLLSKDAVLLGSIERLDYGRGKAQSLISARNATNIGILGEGEIDGRGTELVENVYKLLKAGIIEDAEWKTKRPGENNRPKIIQFELCNNVQIKGVTIKNGSGWIQEYLRCNNVWIDSIKVNSTAYWNNDGIDIVNSKNVVVRHCEINASDDAICLKSEGEVLDSCVNVYIENCKLRSSANAVKLGTSSDGGFRNVVVRNIDVWDTYRSAIALEAVDGGFLENVNVSNVRAVNTGNALFVKLGHRNKNEKYSTVKNIHLQNMYVEVPAGKPDKGYSMEGPLLQYPPNIKPSENGELQSVSPWNYTSKERGAVLYEHNVFPASISGLPEHYVQDISLENIEIVYEGGADKNRAFFPWPQLEKITEAETSYPEFSMFGELPAWGLYVRHVKDISLKNVTIRCTKEDFRVPCIFDDVVGLRLEKLSVPQVVSNPVLLLNNVKNYQFKDLSLAGREKEAIVVQ